MRAAAASLAATWRQPWPVWPWPWPALLALSSSWPCCPPPPAAASSQAHLAPTGRPKWEAPLPHPDTLPAILPAFNNTCHIYRIYLLAMTFRIQSKKYLLC